MTFLEVFTLAGGSVVLATYIGRRAPYLGALVLVFPAKVIMTLVFLPGEDKQLLSEFLLALVPGLAAVAAFALAMRAALLRLWSPGASLSSAGLGRTEMEAGKNFVLC